VQGNISPKTTAVEGAVTKFGRRIFSAPSLGLFIIIVLLLATIIPFFGYYPTYDGNQYFGCIVNAVNKHPFNLLNFRCFKHPFSYSLLLGATQYLDSGNAVLMYLANFCLASISTVAVYKLVRLSLVEDSIVTPLLSAAIFCFMPLYVVHILQIDLDFGVASFYIIFVFCLLTKRRWCAVLLAIMTVLAKEIGIAAYIGTIFAYLYIFVLMEEEPVRAKIIRLMREWPLIFPVMVAIAYMFFLPLLLPKGEMLFFMQGNLPPNFITGFNLDNASMRAFLAFIFILNFNWILSGLILLSLSLAPLQWKSISQRVKGRYFCFFLLLLLNTTYVVTRLHETFWIPRYALLCLPVLAILFGLAVASLLPRKPYRFVLFLPILVLFYLSNFRTIDPLSMRIFRTAPVGEKAILNVAMSQMNFTYSLESIDVFYALRKMLEDVPHDPKHTLFVLGNTAPPLREAAMSLPPKDRSLRATNRLGEITPEGLDKLGSHERLLYVDIPNSLGNNNYEYLKAHYRLVDSRHYQHNGYVLTTYLFVR